MPTGEDDNFNDLFLFNAAIEFPAPQVNFFLEFDWKKFTNFEPRAAGLPVGLADTTRSDNILTLTPGIAVPMSNGFEIKGQSQSRRNRLATGFTSTSERMSMSSTRLLTSTKSGQPSVSSARFSSLTPCGILTCSSVRSFRLSTGLRK